MYIVRSAKNNRLILCTDNQFHAESMVGVGGFSAKLYKTKKNAERSCGEKSVVVDEQSGTIKN